MELLSDREKNLLAAIARHNTVKNAAHDLRSHHDPKIRDENMTDEAAYQILYRIRARYVDARTFINTILGQRKINELSRKVLTPSVKLEKEEPEAEG